MVGGTSGSSNLPTPVAGSLPGSVALENLGQAPEFTGITAWINSNPLTMASLRGKVVLVEFWTFGCINCIHVAPYVKAWEARYADAGLVVIGVHTPELPYEREIANVREAVVKAEDPTRWRSIRPSTPGTPTATATGRPSSSSTSPAKFATSTTARATTTAPSRPFASCWPRPPEGKDHGGDGSVITVHDAFSSRYVQRQACCRCVRSVATTRHGCAAMPAAVEHSAPGQVPPSGKTS